jgi:hypothetical protein
MRKTLTGLLMAGVFALSGGLAFAEEETAPAPAPEGEAPAAEPAGKGNVAGKKAAIDAKRRAMMQMKLRGGAGIMRGGAGGACEAKLQMALRELAALRAKLGGGRPFLGGKIGGPARKLTPAQIQEMRAKKLEMIRARKGGKGAPAEGGEKPAEQPAEQPAPAQDAPAPAEGQQ